MSDVPEHDEIHIYTAWRDDDPEIDIVFMDTINHDTYWRLAVSPRQAFTIGHKLLEEFDVWQQKKLNP